MELVTNQHFLKDGRTALMSAIESKLDNVVDSLIGLSDTDTNIFVVDKVRTNGMLICARFAKCTPQKGRAAYHYAIAHRSACIKRLENLYLQKPHVRGCHSETFCSFLCIFIFSVVAGNLSDWIEAY